MTFADWLTLTSQLLEYQRLATLHRDYESLVSIFNERVVTVGCGDEFIDEKLLAQQPV